MKKSLWFAAAVLSLGLACTDPAKVPAEAAVQAADTAVASLTDVAQKYMPAETQALQQSLASAKDLLAKKDYKAALAAAGEIPGKATALLAAATAKKDELMKGWTDVAAQIPQMLGALKSRLDILSQAKKLPAGMEKSTVEQAQAGVTAIEAAFGDAQQTLQGGDIQAATAKANELKAQGLEIMKSIGMM